MLDKITSAGHILGTEFASYNLFIVAMHFQMQL